MGETGPERPTILFVDDDAPIRRLVTLALQRAGYEVAVAENGRQAWEQLSSAAPDLIISDVMMPELDGFGLLRRVRADPGLRAVPVILLTARGATDDVVAGLDLGADDYLAKPFEVAELIARVRAKIRRPPAPGDLVERDLRTGLLSEARLRQEVEREKLRVDRGGSDGAVAYLQIHELPVLRERLGGRADVELARQLRLAIAAELSPLDLAGVDRAGRLVLLLPDTTVERAERTLRLVTQRIAGSAFRAAGESLRLTPVVGWTQLRQGESSAQVHDQALTAAAKASNQLDLEPRRYHPSMGSWVRQSASSSETDRAGPPRRRLRTALQIGLTLILGWLIPYFIYRAADAWGLDISPAGYLVIVLALAVTAVIIWTEGLLAQRRIDPAEPGAAFPPATAIIAAYLPNEAATVLESIEAFLEQDYPAPLQIILAYNTPQTLPVEAALHELARREPRFTPLRVEGSSSKAQNINAALPEARGEFVGIFDADHHPAPGSFRRAWGWLSNGYDVVQGRCRIRNGTASFVARLVTVEFELIYGITHPGRARLHTFGIFGGSNGYWKTDLLRRIRMRSSMLTEDIDSSIRAVADGHRIQSDPWLVSSELAPATWRALWNQRNRWAQGWYQVSLSYLGGLLGSPRLTLRQKAGLFWLLGWREVYPWISVQMFPLIAFWALKYGGLNRLDWLVPVFVLTTVFTLSAGPGLVLLAYRVATPETRQYRRWFIDYLLAGTLFYAEFKNEIGRVAQIKEWMGERVWRVTPRGPADA